MNLNHPNSWHNPFPDEVSLERRSLEETLRHTQAELERYRRLYENIPSVYFTLNQTGVIVGVNQFGAARLGYTAEELIQKPIFSLFHLDDQQKLLESLTTLLNSSSTQLENSEFRLVDQDSNISWVKATARTVQGWEQDPVILMICEDITERKSAEEAALAPFVELENLDRLKDEFLSTVSHELRTPVTNMKMALQMLAIALNQERDFLAEMAKPLEQRSKAARYYQILHDECEREISLINNFLDLQQLDAGAKPLVLETIQLKQWLPNVVNRFQWRSRNSKVSLQLSIAPNSPDTLLSDAASLERILVELLNNACKYASSDEKITLAAELRSSSIQLQVTNSGVEIPAAELSRIFDKFYRIPSSDPWKQGGTGLGLSLVQKLTQHLGGTISVESTSGQTCFSIELPHATGSSS